MSEYLDHLIQALELEAEQARADLRLVRLHKKNSAKRIETLLKRLAQRIDALKQIRRSNAPSRGFKAGGQPSGKRVEASEGSGPASRS